MILYELQKGYYYIYQSWKTNYQVNPPYYAGNLICLIYEKLLRKKKNVIEEVI